MVQTRCSPLEYDGQRMPIDCFHELWRSPGFKYEYGNGRAEISVQRSAAPIVCASPSMIVEAVSGLSSAPEDISIKWAKSASVEELADLWLDVFVRTPDYYGYSVKDIEREVSNTLDSLYDGESPGLHPCSVVALWEETPVGMLLINKNRQRPLIEAVGVRPDVQHRGVGTVMVEKAAQSLQDKGENVLCSGHLLANARSAAWHVATGFIEIPDLFTTNNRFRCAQHNLKTGLVRDVGGMKRYVETLWAELKKMRQDQDEDSDAHAPFRWIQTDGDRIDNFLSEHVSQHETESPLGPAPPHPPEYGHSQ